LLQTTLLGLAVAIILALVAALVGPLLIDWGAYRSSFEAEAARLLGTEVQIRGAIDARLLPTPQLTLHDIEIGNRADTSVRARSLGVEFALTPMMRGEWRATQLHIVAPRLSLALNASGNVQAPALAVQFDPDALTIEHVTVQDGEIYLADAASGSAVTLDKVAFNGEARSLLGPFNGDGTANVAGTAYPFRLVAGRYTEGRLKVTLNVDLLKQPLSVEAQGTVGMGGGKPDFDGSISLRRPVVLASGGGGAVSPPWRLSGKVKATAASALVREFQLDYGSPERGFKLSGVADFTFGKQPRFTGVLSGRQIDVDRALGGDSERASPADAIGKLAQLAGGVFRPAIPIQIGIGIDQVTLGGDTVQNLRGDISTRAQGWNLDRFEFRAPGFTDVRLSGRLAVDDNHAVFTGPIDIKSNNPLALAGWVEGRALTTKDQVKSLALHGQLTLADDRVALDDLNAEFDRKTLTGRFAYLFASTGHAAQLDAALAAPELDIDAALGFGNELLAGSPIERPHDITLAADIARATLAGFPAKDASARLKVSSEGLQIDRLAVADLGGAAFSASGRIVTVPPSPHGSLQFDLNAPDMTPITALLARYAPQTAQLIARHEADMAPSNLHGTLTVEGATSAAEAKLVVEGGMGKTRVALEGGITADLFTLEPRDVQLRGKISADDGKALLGMLRIDQAVAAGAGPGELTLDSGGPLRGEWRIAAKLKAAGIDASATGTAKPLADKPSANLRLVITKADAAPLQRGVTAALPVTLSGQVTVNDADVLFDDFSATIDGAAARGKIGMTWSSPHQVRGEVTVDRLDAASLVATAIGLPLSPDSKTGGWRWSAEPFANAWLGDFQGAVKLNARQVELLPGLGGLDFKATLALGVNEFSLNDMAATVAGGAFSGRLAFRRDQSLRAQAKIELSGADAAALFPAARIPMTATVAISGEAEGAGLSPVALIGSLHGAGKLTLRDAHIAGLDPRVFATVARAADQGLTVDAAHVSDAASKALAAGRLAVKRAEGGMTIAAGQVRLDKLDADSEGARLTAAGSLDLADGSLNGRIVLSGLDQQAGTRPDIFMTLNGPVTGIERTIDFSALTSWLTLRAVENQARQLQNIERGAPPAPDGHSTQKSLPAPSARGTVPAKKESAVTPRSEAPAIPAAEIVLPPRPPGATRAASPPVKRNRAPTLPAPVDIGRVPNPVGGNTSAAGQQN
jgi:large subunit ribosomal protein L24